MAKDVQAGNEDNPRDAERNNGGHDEFVLQVIAVQTRLYAYILSLSLDKDRARDILQQTNLVLLEKETEYEQGTNFGGWASRVAYYEVLADRRRRYRDRHLFSDELLALVASRASAIGESLDARAEALESCLNKLSSEHRQLVIERYRPGGSVAAIAEELRKSPAAISAMLYRIRGVLVDCIQRKLMESAKP